MAIILQVSRHSWKTRLLVWFMYALLLAGSVTMIYPFWLMLAGAVSSEYDFNDFRLVPKYLFSDDALLGKTLYERYGKINFTAFAARYGIMETCYGWSDLRGKENLVDHLYPEERKLLQTSPSAAKKILGDYHDFKASLPPQEVEPLYPDNPAPFRDFLRKKYSRDNTSEQELIDQINRHRSSHIITIEDPIEYVHENIESLIEQRELHSDTMSFATALKYALRQAPDVIMVGEMRDVDTMAAALTAAETGHLVFATVHTNSAPQTIDRIIDSFPQAHQNQIRAQLSAVILAVVSQRLLPRVDGKGRVAAFELMIGTPPVQSVIREGKTHQLPSVMETSAKDGMVTLEKALEELYGAGMIAIEDMKRLQVEYRMSKPF